MNVTLDYYNANAVKFTESTASVDFSSVQDEFLALLPQHARILDFGCGSGRDTKCFLDHGHDVTPTDGSSELCEIASRYAGIPVRQMLFCELDDVDEYDAVWACSSILHVCKAELPDIFRRIHRALHSDGILYTSFKYGDFDGMRNGRHFSDFNKETIAAFLQETGGFDIEQLWITGDVRPGRGDERWLNLILRKI